MKTAAAFASYLVLWTVALACYWADGTGSASRDFSLLALRLLLPLGAFAAACAAGAASPWRVRKLAAVAALGIAYVAALGLTHGLSGAAATATDFSAGPDGLVAGAVFAGAGLAAGAIARARYAAAGA
jgi:hypothetical protein